MTTLLLTTADAPPTEVTLSDAELDQLLDQTGAEFIDGQLKEKSMGAESEGIGSELQGTLWAFVHANRLGRVFNPATPYRCFPSDPRQVRKPDVSFVAAARLPAGGLPRGNLTFAPDLAVEVISPTDKYEDVEQKVADYRSAGVRLIWVVNPATRSVLIRRLDRTCAELDAAGTLDGEDVVPGFACRVAELFV